VKSWISLILAAIFLISIAVFNIRQPKKPIALPTLITHATPTIIPSPTLSSTDCQITDMKGTISFEGAAGSIYGTITLTNTSTVPCTLSLKNNLKLNYLSTVKNISVTYTGTPSAQAYKLFPKNSVYALIHMPNGPQCQSDIHQVQASLSYMMSTSQEISFTSRGKSEFMINSCTNQEDITKIDISELSLKPLP